MPDPAGFAELRARMVERYPEISPQQKGIPEFALAHPETMAMETAAQLAQRLGVQPSSLVRFAQALDYPGFNEMKPRPATGRRGEGNAGNRGRQQRSELAGPRDATLPISFAPYQPSVVQAAKAHADRGGSVVGRTDTPLSPLAPFAEILLEIPHREPTAAHALAGVTCLVQALAVAVCRYEEC